MGKWGGRRRKARKGEKRSRRCPLLVGAGGAESPCCVSHPPEGSLDSADEALEDSPAEPEAPALPPQTSRNLCSRHPAAPAAPNQR